MSALIQERQFKIETSHRLWSEVIEQHQLNCLFKEKILHSFTTQLCYLTKGPKTTRGAGKGKNPDEIKMSASFEALEFYLTGYYYHPYTITTATIAEITQQHELLLYRCKDSVFNNKNNQQAQLPWAIYQDIQTHKTYAAPLATVDLSYLLTVFENDTFNYKEAEVYSASNGVASGASYGEAVIHAALEVIERDAYSYFLIDTFILNKKPLFVDKQSLPNDFLTLVTEVESRYGNEIVIIQMPSRFGVYAYLALPLNKEFEIQPRGGGASLNAHFALERALYEMIQSYNLFHGDYNENQIDPNKLLNNSLIKQFLEADFKQTWVDQRFESVKFHNNDEEFSKLSLSNYLNTLVQLINAQQSSLLVNTVYKNPNGLHCVRVIIPEAEEFFLATHYIKMDPSPPAQSYIQAQLGYEFKWDNYSII